MKKMYWKCGAVLFGVIFLIILQRTYNYSLSVCPNNYPQDKTGYLRTLERVTEIKSENELIPILDDVHLCPKTLHSPLITGEKYEFQPVKERQILVFSAFYESRAKANGPAIRIIAAGLQRAYNDVGDLHCTLWYEGRLQGVSVGPALYDNIYPSVLHHEQWCSHFIFCPLPNHLHGVPYAVSVTHEPCETADNELFVVNHQEVIHQGQHAVCYPILYNRFKNWTMLIEMFELQRLLGAEHITIYDYTSSQETGKVLKYLKTQGWVSVIPWPFPHGYYANVFFQRAALNDCLYRYMHRYKYISVHDLDEVLVPRAFSNWSDLLRTIDIPIYGAFLFQHVYFRRNETVQSSTPNNLITQSSFYRTDEVTPPGKIRCKAMYKGEDALKLDLHFPYDMVPGSKQYILEPEEGILHHYRATPMEGFNKQPDKYTYIEDRYMELYADDLQNSYQGHKEKLKGYM